MLFRSGRHAVAEHGVRDEVSRGRERGIREREEHGVVGEEGGGIPGRPGEREGRGGEEGRQAPARAAAMRM